MKFSEFGGYAHTVLAGLWDSLCQYEINGVRGNPVAGSDYSIDNGNPEFFSVYARLSPERTEDRLGICYAVGDFKTAKEAYRYAQKLCKKKDLPIVRFDKSDNEEIDSTLVVIVMKNGKISDVISTGKITYGVINQVDFPDNETFFINQDDRFVKAKGHVAESMVDKQRTVELLSCIRT
ncbi:MAG: hypothetical protein KGI54_15185 [Pseudomonadota bacterium]|nr:hypothetical protein [Pseudomonadota bacterium]